MFYSFVTTDIKVMKNSISDGIAAFFVSILVTGFVAAGFALGLLSSLVNGYVGMVLWNWFIHPLGVPDISYAQGAGIALLFAFLLPNIATEKSENPIAQMIGWIILRPAFVLLFGWLIHTWFMH